MIFFIIRILNVVKTAYLAFILYITLVLLFLWFNQGEELKKSLLSVYFLSDKTYSRKLCRTLIFIVVFVGNKIFVHNRVSAIFTIPLFFLGVEYYFMNQYNLGVIILLGFVTFSTILSLIMSYFVYKMESGRQVFENFCFPNKDRTFCSDIVLIWFGNMTNSGTRNGLLGAIASGTAYFFFHHEDQKHHEWSKEAADNACKDLPPSIEKGQLHHKVQSETVDGYRRNSGMNKTIDFIISGKNSFQDFAQKSATKILDAGLGSWEKFQDDGIGRSNQEAKIKEQQALLDDGYREDIEISNRLEIYLNERKLQIDAEKVRIQTDSYMSRVRNFFSKSPDIVIHKPESLVEKVKTETKELVDNGGLKTESLVEKVKTETKELVDNGELQTESLVEKVKTETKELVEEVLPKPVFSHVDHLAQIRSANQDMLRDQSTMPVRPALDTDGVQRSITLDEIRLALRERKAQAIIALAESEKLKAENERLIAENQKLTADLEKSEKNR